MKGFTGLLILVLAALCAYILHLFAAYCVELGIPELVADMIPLVALTVVGYIWKKLDP